MVLMGKLNEHLKWGTVLMPVCVRTSNADLKPPVLQKLQSYPEICSLDATQQGTSILSSCGLTAAFLRRSHFPILELYDNWKQRPNEA